MCEECYLGNHLFSLVSNPMENHFKITDINHSWDLYSYGCHVAKTVKMLFNTLSIFFFEKDSCLNLIHVGTVDAHMHVHVCVDKICFLWIFKLYIACILCITVSVIITNSHISYIFIV